MLSPALPPPLISSSCLACNSRSCYTKHCLCLTITYRPYVWSEEVDLMWPSCLNPGLFAKRRNIKSRCSFYSINLNRQRRNTSRSIHYFWFHPGYPKQPPSFLRRFNSVFNVIVIQIKSFTNHLNPLLVVHLVELDTWERWAQLICWSVRDLLLGCKTKLG